MTDMQLVLDNRINISPNSTKMVHVSGVQNNFFEVQPDGNNGSYSSSLIFNNVITPSLSNTLVSRNIRLRYNVQIATTADWNGTQPILAVGAAGPAGALRAFPLQSATSNISLIINGATSSLSSRSILSATQRKLSKEFIEKEATEGPAMADNSAILIQDAAASCSSQQPLSGYYNSDGTTRGSFRALGFLPAAGGQPAVYTFEVSESLMISPLSVHSEENFLANINTLSLQLNFNQIALNDMFVFPSLGNAYPVQPAGIAVTISNPVLQLTYIQVSNELVQIPRMVQYPYENLVYFQRDTGQTFNTGAANYAVTTAPLISDTLRLQSMPSLIYIYARPRFATTREAPASGCWADTFLALGKLSGNLETGPALNGAASGSFLPNVAITLGNRSGLLSSASNETLYRMSVRNGYRGTYQDWQWGSGSLIILDPVADLGINLQSGDILPGESGSVNFQFQANYCDCNYAAASAAAAVATANNKTFTAELVIVPVYSGVVSITPDNCVFNIGDLTEAEVNHLLATAPKDGTAVSSEAVKPTIQGGSLFGKMKSILGHTANAISTYGPMAVKLAEHAKNLTGGVISGASLRRRR